MHSFILGITLTLTGLAPLAALARPIARCQFHLLETKAHLAQIEIEKFDRLRIQKSALPSMLRGLLIAVYEADLEGESVALSEAVTYVPAVSLTAVRYVERAAEDGLINIAKDEGQRRTLTPGPRLRELIRAEIAANLARIYDDLDRLSITAPIEVGSLPAVQSAGLTRALIKKAWLDFDRVWQPGTKKADVHVRHTYGLLVHLYLQHLRGTKASLLKIHEHVPLGAYETRRKFIDESIQAELMALEASTGKLLTPNLIITPPGIAYVEGRINEAIDRTNAILRRASEDNP